MDVARFNVVSVAFRIPEVGIGRPVVEFKGPLSGAAVEMVLVKAPAEVLDCKLPLKLVTNVFDVVVLVFSTAPVVKVTLTEAVVAEA